VRELQNAVERAVALAETDLVLQDDLPEHIRRTVLDSSQVETMLGRLSPLRKEIKRTH
jgi:DNA-binding NtrC family response regulator